MRLLLRVLGLLVVLSLLPAVARAQETGGDARARAKQLLDEGLQLVGDARFASALERFERAHALYPSPRLLINIGTALRQLGRNAEAARAYERYLSDPHADPERKPQIRVLIREIDRVTGWVGVSLNAPNAELRIDGTALALSGKRLRWRVDPGEHTLVARVAGKLPAIRTVRVAAGETVDVSLELDDVQAPIIRVVESGASTKTVIGVSLLAAAGAGLVVGGVFGVLAQRADERAAEHCVSRDRCDARGVALGETAEDRARVSTIAFIGAGVFAAAGLTLLIAPFGQDSREGVSVTLSPATIAGRVSF